MSVRFAGVVVTFEGDIRDDDAEATLAALRQIKGVLTVEAVVADVPLHMAEQRARFALERQLWAVLHPSAA